MMKKKWLNSILGLAGLIALQPLLHGQAVPTASRRGGRIQAGVGAMYLNNDYTPRRTYGLSFWGDYDFTRFVGAEIEGHIGTLITPDDVGENSYLIGPRFTYHRRNFNPYGKVMFGRGTIVDQFPGHHNNSFTYNIYAFGGGLDYTLPHKLKLRIPDVEMEKWGDFEPHTLTPINVSVGLMYTFR